MKPTKRFATSLFVIAVLVFCSGAHTGARFGIVCEDDPEFEQIVSEAAEGLFIRFSEEWFGQQLSHSGYFWQIRVDLDQQSVPIGAVRARPDLINGGNLLSIAVLGDKKGILTSALPHEISHVVMITALGSPLPVWANEGIAQINEGRDSWFPINQNLLQTLVSRRGMEFSRMFEVMGDQYEEDEEQALYQQGYSLCCFLLRYGDKRRLTSFIGAGMQHRNWRGLLPQFYPFRDLHQLQDHWLAWVKQGSPHAQRVFSDSALPMAGDGFASPPQVKSTGDSKITFGWGSLAGSDEPEQQPIPAAKIAPEPFIRRGQGHQGECSSCAPVTQ